LVAYPSNPSGLLSGFNHRGEQSHKTCLDIWNLYLIVQMFDIYSVSMDLLNDVLKTLRLSSKVFLDAKFCDEWVIDISSMNLQVSFHVIANGDCWIQAPVLPEPVALHAGDLVICLRNTPHYVTCSAEPPPDDLPRNTPSTEDKPKNATQLICGYCEFLQYYWNPIL
jgi:hypothetical protein